MDLEVISVISSIASVVVTGTLAWIVHRSTLRITRLEFARSIREAWISLDGLALSDPETLQVADALLNTPDDAPATVEFARKRWFVLAYLNPIVTAYQGARDGLYGNGRREVIRGVRTQLKTLLRDDDAFWITQHHGHEPSFQALCRELRRDVEREHAKAGAEA